MRPRAPALLVAVVLLLAGCVSRAPPAALDEEALIAPPLPPGVELRGGERVESNATSVAYAWRGVLAAVAEGDAAVAELAFPGTVPAQLAVAMRAEDDLLLEVRDEYGARYCASSAQVDGAVRCSVGEIAPLGWPRTWTIRVSADAASGPRLPFEVEATFATAPGRVVDAIAPAGLREVVPFETRAEDGVLLSGDVYLPEGAAPFATVLVFSPYWNGGPNDQTENYVIEVDGRRTIPWTLAGPLGVLLDAGYAVALVNMRGTGESGGCNPWFDLDRDGLDAAAVIEALASESWSNGNVGMMGISWHGYSQYAALGAAPPSLKAVAPSSAILDPWLLWTRHGAPLRTPPPLLTGAGFYSVFLLDHSGYGNLGDRTPDHLTCPEYASHALEAERLSELGDETPFWHARRAHDALAGSRVPVFATNGLYSPHEGHILQIDGLWPLLPPGSHLMVGPWGHEYPSDGGADRYLRMLLDFFDEHLRGGPPRLAPGVTYQELTGTWRHATSWPPSDAPARLLLSGSALVDAEATVEPSSRTFQTLEGATPFASDCPFWVAYASAPLAAPLELAGNFEVSLPLTSTAPDGNLAAFLWQADDVAACAAGSDAQLVARAVSDLRHRGGALRQGSPFPVGIEETLQMRSHPFATTIPEGARLVLVVGGDDGNDEARDKALLPAITLRTGEGAQAWLELPLAAEPPSFRAG